MADSATPMIDELDAWEAQQNQSKLDVNQLLGTVDSGLGFLSQILTGRQPQAAPVVDEKDNTTTWIIAVVVILILTVVGIFAWKRLR